MQITLFGAGGKTGKLVVEQALAAGYTVVAFLRTPSNLELQNPRLKIVQGDILDAAAVARAVHGSSAVISVLAPTSNEPTPTIARGTKNILDAMQQAHVSRLVLSTGAGVPNTGDQPKFADKLFVFVLKLVSKNVYQDMVETVDVVRSSNCAWTIVRVPRLTDAPPTGNLRVGAVGKDIGTQIGRADMARFIVEQLSSDKYIQQAPAISN